MYTSFTILFIFGFCNIYISKHKAFIGRSRNPATSEIEIFVNELKRGKPLIINTKRTVLDVSAGL